MKKKWIPVDAFPPEYGIDVLVCYRFGHTVAYLIPDIDGDVWIKPISAEITHWQELPDLPLDSNNEEE